MLQTWNTILAAVLLPLASNAGTATLQIEDADRNVEAVFLGWEGAILAGNVMTEKLLDAVCDGAPYPNCPNHDPNDPYVLAQFFSATLGAGPGGIFTFEDFVATFGSEERSYAVGETIEKLRSANGMQGVYMVSTSVYPFTAEQWKNFLNGYNQMLGLGFADDEIITLADPGPPGYADTGLEIQQVMGTIGVQFDEAIWVDSSETIDAATEVVNTLSLPAGGLTDTDRLYLEMLGTFPLPLGEAPTCPEVPTCPETTTSPETTCPPVVTCPETTCPPVVTCPETTCPPVVTCPETTCPPDVSTTEAPTGIVYANKACGSRTHIGKAHDPALCMEKVMDDARCTNKDYFMYRAANAACNCVGAADDCSSDLHTVAGVHIYSVSFFV